MNFVSLVTHGLRAMSVFGDRIGVRLLVATASLLALTVGLAALTMAARLGADLTVPYWVAPTSALVIALLLQALVTTLAFVLVTLQSSSGAGVLPLRDHVYFVEECRMIYSARERAPQPA